MYTREKHPINDLVNADMVEDIFLELEDTSRFDVVVQDVMGKPRDREMIKFYELERDTDSYLVEESTPFNYYHRMKAVEKTYEIIKMYKIAIIKPFGKPSDLNFPRSISNLTNNIDVMEITERVKDYLGEELTHIHSDAIGLDMNGDWYRNIESGEKIDSPVMVIYFNSYKSKEYKYK